ncbi:hypothetical protein N9O57_01060 [bacterium]|nr:hypothetical protein [bacterium]
MKESNLRKALFALRCGVFIVMFMWTIDKFINPVHTSRVFAKYYLIDGLSNVYSYAVGGLQLVLVLGFLLGVKKRLTYGLIFFMHAISTLSSYAMYLDPWGPKNLLFFAAWPMLAAIYALYILRDEDTLFTIK